MRVTQLNIQSRGTGADRCARELFDRLPGLGVPSRLWVSRRAESDPPGVDVIGRAYERWLAPLEAFPDLTDWRHRGSIVSLRSLGPPSCDLLHAHILHSGWASIRAVHEVCERMPVVWTLHDEWAPKLGLTYDLSGKITPSEVKALSHGPLRWIPYHRYHENYKWRRTRAFLRQWLPQPRVVLCPSRYLLNLTERSGVFRESELVHLPNGVVMPELAESTGDREQARARFGIPPHRKVVLMISADLAQAHKGIGLGLEALRALRALHAPGDLHLLLLGARAQRVAREVPELSVTCAETHDDREIAQAYRAADVTLIPSLGENLPYVALESLACETPIVAFPIGGMREIAGEDERGLIADGLDPLALTRLLRRLLADAEERARLGRNGRAWVRAECDMESYLRRVVDIYRGALADRAR